MEIDEKRAFKPVIWCILIIIYGSLQVLWGILALECALTYIDL